MKLTHRTLTPAEKAALRSCQSLYGRYWKTRINEEWQSSEPFSFFSPEERATLMQLRNVFGPSWLANLRPAGIEKDSRTQHPVAGAPAPVPTPARTGTVEVICPDPAVRAAVERAVVARGLPSAALAHPKPVDVYTATCDGEKISFPAEGYNHARTRLGLLVGADRAEAFDLERERPAATEDPSSAPWHVYEVSWRSIRTRLRAMHEVGARLYFRQIHHLPAIAGDEMTVVLVERCGPETFHVTQ